MTQQSADIISSAIETVIGAAQFIAVFLIGLLTYLAREIRTDVRDMKEKVAVLWDRYERGGVVPPSGVYRSVSPNATERL